MEFRHSPPGVDRLGVSDLPHPSRGASTLSTCRMASVCRFGPLPPFPRSLVTNSPRTNEGDPDATAARAKNDLIRENLPQGIISNLLREGGYPAWIRTRNSAS